MITFSHDQLRKLASWEPVAAGFGRDSPTMDALIGCIRRAFERIPADVLVVADGGLSNYFGCILTPKGEMKTARQSSALGNLSGIAALLSLLGPYGVLGFVRFSVRRDGWAWNGVVPSDIVSSVANGFPGEASAVLQQHGYTLLEEGVVSQALPADVVPYGYCLSSEPWNKIFHVLFSDTD